MSSSTCIIARKLKKLESDRRIVGIIAGALLLVFIILLITDLTGLTDVFPFVKKHR